MMKAIMISIQPQHCGNILNLIKILEIRKTCPKEWKNYLNGKTSVKPEPCKVVIYCTRNKHLGMVVGNGSAELFRCCNCETGFIAGGYLGNGKVVAEFMLKQIDLLEFRHLSTSHTNVYIPVNEDADYEWEKHCCVHYDDIVKYGKLAPIYAWHIDNLIIYDEPKELREFSTTPNCFNAKNIEFKENAFGEYVPQYHENSFCKICKYYDGDWGDCNKGFKALKRPPQSWCYVEELLGGVV